MKTHHSTTPSLHHSVSGRSRTGKIARLPKSLRDIVNRMLEDGKHHKTIIAELEKHRSEWPPEVTTITTGNLSQWRKGGYKDWLRDQTIKSQFQLLAEAAADAPNPMALANLLAQLNMYQLYLRLAAFDPSTIKPESLADPVEHARVINASSRAIRSAIAVQKHCSGRASVPASRPSDPEDENLKPFTRENLRKFERLIGLPDGTYSNSRTRPHGWYYPDRPNSTLSDQSPCDPNPNPSDLASASAADTPPQPSPPDSAKAMPPTTDSSVAAVCDPAPDPLFADGSIPCGCPPSATADRGYSPIELMNYLIHRKR